MFKNFPKLFPKIFWAKKSGVSLPFNVGGRGYNRGIKKGKRMKTICVFCMNVWGADAMSCPTCHEYKGIMPLNKDTLTYLGEDLDEWANEL